MKYVIFLRLLCQKKITEEEINDSQNIILDFMIEFEKLYGKKFMNSNLHGHLHLPRQVKRFGPLNIIREFSFIPVENKNS
ncbi:hypothetical protein BpHYR1_019162 [Brachionus plicatilis]|uniref:Uncharacterized protein n=1 Tax=Brachionus plicatilis TaxID=10195 RepID=A0A3M7RWV1_BRAPC|nr:hypothetical protein BpHYR1_019162 [Brachionus plicatilis]